MNMYLHELKAYRKSLIIWAIALSVIVVVFLTLYPSFTHDVESSKKALANIPPAVRSVLDVQFNTFFTIFGFYSYALNFVLLAGSIQAMVLGTGIISKEENGKTSDFLLSKPIRRRSVVSNKLAAALSILVLTNLVFISVSWLMAQLVAKDSFSSQTFLMLTFILFFVQLAFLALGMLLSVSLSRIKSVISVALPTVFIFFIISTLGAIFGNENVRYITPFKFYDPNYIITHNAYEMKYVIIEAIFVIIAIVATYFIYARKDTRSAS